MFFKWYIYLYLSACLYIIYLHVVNTLKTLCFIVQHFLTFNNIWLVYQFKLHVWQYMTKYILTKSKVFIAQTGLQKWCNFQLEPKSDRSMMLHTDILSEISHLNWVFLDNLCSMLSKEIRDLFLGIIRNVSAKTHLENIMTSFRILWNVIINIAQSCLTGACYFNSS